MPEKHHYIPVFYLKRWAGPDRRLCVYSRPHKEVRALRRHPEATAFEYDPYTIQGVDLATASHLERRFFLQADNDAAQTLAHMEADPKKPLTVEQRSAWSRFIMCLVHRNPETVARLREQVRAEANRTIREFRENYAVLKRSDDPDTFEEYERQNRTGYIGRTSARLMQAVMDSDRVGKLLNKMTWTILNLPSAYPLLASDRPLIMTNGISKPESHIAIPISPRKLFVAANDPSFAAALASEDPNDVVKRANERLTEQARNLVFGVDDQQLRFVGNRLGTRLPMSPTDTLTFP
jgi:hypothetical protein